MKNESVNTIRNQDHKSNASIFRFIHSGAMARLLLVLLFFSMLLPQPDAFLPARVLAAPGDLVSGFGAGGIVMTDFAGGNDAVNAIAVTPTGKIIAAGAATIPGKGTDFALALYDEIGNLDLNFGEGGKVTVDFFSANDGARGVEVQNDGKIYVAGFATNGGERQTAIIRLNPDGTIDTTFGQNGKLILDLGSTSEAFKVALQDDGKIVAVGDSRPQNSLDFTVIRLNPSDGSLDNSFGNNGVARVDFGFTDRAIDLAISDTNIYVCGIVAKSAADFDFGIASLNLNGSLNNTFGGDGTVTTDFFGKQDGAQSIRFIDIPDPSNPKILVGGFATDATSDFALARYKSDGSLDTSFDGDGKQTIDISGSFDQAFGLIDQPDGDIVAAGWAGKGANFDLGLIKWNENGSLNLSWGLQGKYTLDTASGANNVAFDAMIYENTIIAGGVGLNPITGNDDFVVTMHENEKFVEFTKTVSPGPTVEGDLLTYTFTIKNLTESLIEVKIHDQLPIGTTFDPARNAFWETADSVSVGGIVKAVRTKLITVRSQEVVEVTLTLRADRSGLITNGGVLLDTSPGMIARSEEVVSIVSRAQVTDVTRDGKNLKVTANSTGANQSSAIALSAIAPQASCPVVLFDGVAQKTASDPNNPSIVLIVKKGFKKLRRGQTVRIRVRLCNDVETDDFLFTKP